MIATIFRHFHRHRVGPAFKLWRSFFGNVAWSVALRHLMFGSIVFAASNTIAQTAFTVPDGYVEKKLDVTGGRIAVPKDWFFSDGRTNSGWAWVISAQDQAKGRYETGLQLHAIVGVELTMKKSRRAFVKDFLSEKKASTAVLRECPETNQGKLKRQCLEVVEDIKRNGETMRYHILYWVFWSNEVDIVGMFMFGAPQDQWASAKQVGEVLAQLEFIGPSFGTE